MRAVVILLGATYSLQACQLLPNLMNVCSVHGGGQSEVLVTPTWHASCSGRRPSERPLRCLRLLDNPDSGSSLLAFFLSVRQAHVTRFVQTEEALALA